MFRWLAIIWDTHTQSYRTSVLVLAISGLMSQNESSITNYNYFWQALLAIVSVVIHAL